jgi:hypothetical protein
MTVVVRNNKRQVDVSCDQVVPLTRKMRGKRTPPRHDYSCIHAL